MVPGRSFIPAAKACAVAAVAVVMCSLAAAAGGAGRAVVVSSARNSALGRIDILVNANGRTLYRSSLRSCTGACAMKWLPLVIPTASTLRAGSGVSLAMLGRIKRGDGRWLVTYHGNPLYLYSGDTEAGDVNGQGVGGVWHALTPGGVTVMKTVAAKSSGNMGTTSGSQGSSSPPMSSSSGSSGSGSSSGAGSSASPGMFCAANPKSCVDGVPVVGTTTTTASG